MSKFDFTPFRTYWASSTDVTHTLSALAGSPRACSTSDSPCQHPLAVLLPLSSHFLDASACVSHTRVKTGVFLLRSCPHTHDSGDSYKTRSQPRSAALSESAVAAQQSKYVTFSCMEVQYLYGRYDCSVVCS